MEKLTREEQLEYLIEFLEGQVELYQYNLELAKIELDNLRCQKLERIEYDKRKINESI